MTKQHKQILILLAAFLLAIASPGVVWAQTFVWAKTENYPNGPDVATSIAVDDNYIYIVGYSASSDASGSTQWQIEKRNKSDGEIILATSVNPSAGDEGALFVIADNDPNGYIYIAGTLHAGVGHDWRIEKRNKSNLNLVSGWPKIIAPGPYSDKLYSMAADDNNLYIAGHEQLSVGDRYYIEARRRSDGAYLWGDRRDYGENVFYNLALATDGDYVYRVGSSKIEKRGTGGMILWTIDSTSLIPHSMVVDDAYLYIALRGWRIEARNKSNGGLVWWKYDDFGPGSARPYSITADEEFVYSAGYYTKKWRLEARRKSDGSFVWTAISPVSSEGEARSITADEEFLYVAGEDSSTGSSQWHIEKWEKAASFIDIGLRVYNSTISPNPIAIAALPLDQADQSPLKVCRDGDTYGIALIAPTDPDYGDAQHDSGVRIQTSAGQMALMRYQ